MGRNQKAGLSVSGRREWSLLSNAAEQSGKMRTKTEQWIWPPERAILVEWRRQVEVNEFRESEVRKQRL